MRGVAARIQSEFPKAVYIHCFSHKLNLVIAKSCEVVALRNTFGVISKVAMFFNKRQAAFAEKINLSEQPIRKKHFWTYVEQDGWNDMSH